MRLRRVARGGGKYRRTCSFLRSGSCTWRERIATFYCRCKKSMQVSCGRRMCHIYAEMCKLMGGNFFSPFARVTVSVAKSNQLWHKDHIVGAQKLTCNRMRRRNEFEMVLYRVLLVEARKVLVDSRFFLKYEPVIPNNCEFFNNIEN